MQALIAELEAATEGSRELDVAIRTIALGFRATNQDKLNPEQIRSHHRHFAAHYTTLLEAALSLAPEGWGWLVRGGDGECFANLTRGSIPIMSHGIQINRAYQDTPTYAATVPLALCIAALKARQAMKEAAE